MISAPSPSDWYAGRTCRAARYQTCSRWTAIRSRRPRRRPRRPRSRRVVAERAPPERQEALAGLGRSRGGRPATRTGQMLHRLADHVVGRPEIGRCRAADEDFSSRSTLATSVTSLAWTLGAARPPVPDRAVATAIRRRNACQIVVSTDASRSSREPAAASVGRSRNGSRPTARPWWSRTWMTPRRPRRWCHRIGRRTRGGGPRERDASRRSRRARSKRDRAVRRDRHPRQQRRHPPLDPRSRRKPRGVAPRRRCEPDRLVPVR